MTSNTTTEKIKMIPGITGDIEYKDPLFTMPSILGPYKVALLSYASSMISTTCGFPLDSIKTRMQIHTYPTALNCLKATILNEGFRGLFRGLAVPLFSTSLTRSLTVSIYTNCKPMVSSIVPSFDIVSIENQETKRFIQNYPVSFLSGVCAGALISLFACPFELTKIFQQIVLVVNRDGNFMKEKSKLPTRVVEIARNIVKYEGLKGLYSGYRFHVVRDGFSAGIFYSVYETVKLTLQAKLNQSKALSDKEKSSLGALCVPLSGAISGSLSWVLVYPIDTVKANYQKDVLRNIIRAKMGLSKLEIKPKKIEYINREMYKGFGPSITRSVGVTMIFFSAFEYFMKNIA